MKYPVAALCCALLLGGFSPSAFADEPKPDYQQIADARTFDWSFERASIFYSFQQYRGTDEVLLLRNPTRDDDPHLCNLRFVRGGKVVFSLQCLDLFAFRALGDVVYYTQYSPFSTGCVVVAFDLKRQKPLWKTSLQGVGPIAHSMYSNLVNLNASAEVIEVYGREAFGDYVEYLNPRTGKTVGHHFFKADSKRLSTPYER